MSIIGNLESEFVEIKKEPQTAVELLVGIAKIKVRVCACVLAFVRQK